MEELDSQIVSVYERHSNKRLATATFLVGLVSIGSALSSYVLFVNSYLTILIFAVASFSMVNLALYLIVPTTNRLKSSKQLILEAVKDPTRVKSVERRHVTLSNAQGDAIRLTGMEQQVWDNLIVPFVMKHGAEKTLNKKDSMVAKSERILAERKKQELSVLEQSIKEESEKLKAEQAELAARATDLKVAENLVIERFSEVELAQAELEQLRENLEFEASDKVVHQDAAGADEISLREQELKAKEAELEQLKTKLIAEERAAAEHKKEFERMQRVAVDVEQPEVAVSADGKVDRESLLKQREAELEARRQELDLATSDLESRYRHIEDAENTLIDRLNQLSEREAQVEQEEINVGSRHD